MTEWRDERRTVPRATTTDILMMLGEEARKSAMKQLREQGAIPGDDEPKPRKYLNIPTVYKSIQGFERKYDSIKEAKRAEALDGLLKARLVRWWFPEPRIWLPGGVNYYPDFIVCWEPDGVVKFEDVKAPNRETQASKNKRKMAFALFGITVELVT